MARVCQDSRPARLLYVAWPQLGKPCAENAATGPVLAAVLTAASIQDRDGARAAAVEPAPRLHQGPPGLG
jgi:hypothetical protein